MGRIKKAAGPKHEATVSPAISEFVSAVVSLPVAHLPNHLKTFPRHWPFPRGDLYHWIPLLNRFDLILEEFTREYSLQSGPQITPFARGLLEKGLPEERKSNDVGISQDELDRLGFGHDGDKELAQEILSFSLVLMENCGNRSLYSSSDRLGALLNTVDLSLLGSALQLALRLAQRYHASRQRGANASQHLNNALLASHYNIDLDKVQHIANPFTKLTKSTKSRSNSVANGTLVGKGKDKLRSPQAQTSTSVQAADLMAIAIDPRPTTNGAAVKQVSPTVSQDTSQWEDWGHVHLRYYRAPSTMQEDTKTSTPTTPTPSRRPSNLSRPSRLSNSEESSEISNTTPAAKAEESSAGGMKSLDIPLVKTSSTPIDILKETVPNLPKESHYELITKIRVAVAMTTSTSTRQQLLIVRLLALANLAYIYPEATFQQKILQQDAEDPRRLQLAYQLAEIIQPPGNGDSGIPVRLQTVAFGVLESLTKHKSRASDVCAALNVNVNHGALLHTLKSAAVDMASEPSPHEVTGDDRDEWLEALFSLLEALPTAAARTGESLIAAGLFDILIEMLNLRTSRAQRYHHKILTFLNTIVYTVRDAFQTFANAKGLDTISDLVALEVSSSMDHANNAQGMPTAYRNQVIDYQIPFFQQQTLRWLFKIINHMMSHGSGNFDRLLRNLIDSPQLLAGLKTVIVNATIFGSSVWSGAVNILSSFIHNEPTSYGIIAEAGLSKGFLEAVSSKAIVEPKDSKEQGNSSQAADTERDGTASANAAMVSALKQLQEEGMQQDVPKEDQGSIARGILPATDAIVTIPQAFGAICLNNAGLNLFLQSQALRQFFQIFQSPEHVKAMNTESELPRLLGSSFDELVRHYPQLKLAILTSVMIMITHVSVLCKSRATKLGLGAKMSVDARRGRPQAMDRGRDVQTASQETQSLSRQGSDVVMEDVDPNDGDVQSLTNSDDIKADELTSMYIGTAMKFLGGFFENTSVCSAFIDAGGAEAVVEIATLPCLQYDFNNQSASHELARVIHMLVEQKPHLVMPSLVYRTQAAVNALESLSNHVGASAFFAPYTNPNQSPPNSNDTGSTNGTHVVKSLVALHTLCMILAETFSPPIFNTRSSHTVFTQVNLTDMYVQLITSFGRLHRVCVWEEILLQNAMPSTWKEATRVKGFGLESLEPDDVLALMTQDEPVSEGDDSLQDASNADASNMGGTSASARVADKKKRRQSSMRRDEDTPQFQNVRALRYLLSQIPRSITSFLQGLGKGLIAKRRPDSYARQIAYMVADAMSAANLEQLKFEAPRQSSSAKDRHSYWIVILTSISRLLIEGSDHSTPQCLTLVLQAFKNVGGLDEIRNLLEIFSGELKVLSDPKQNIDVTEAAARRFTADGGIKIILHFYTHISAGKTVIESPQTASIQSNDRDRGHPHYFLPPQFLIELRMAVLPVVRSIWKSDFVDKALSPIVKSIIEILRINLESNEEQGAYKRGDKVPTRLKHTHKVYPLPEDRIKSLEDQGFQPELAREALYRCFNGLHNAEEYCRSRQRLPSIRNHPIPDYDKEPQKDTIPTPQRSEDQAEELSPEHTEPTTETVHALEGFMSGDENEPSSSADSFPPAPTQPVDDAAHDSLTLPAAPAGSGGGGEPMAMSIDTLPSLADLVSGDFPNLHRGPSSGQATPSNVEVNLVPAAKVPDLITVNDLDDERSAIREDLIERALDVLNVHGDATFELADLINAAASKASDRTSMRHEIGETLVQSLISLQQHDDFRPQGKKIAATANLLGLVLQDDDFYMATLDDLKNNFSQLLAFIKIFPDQGTEESSPWIGQVLLVIERVLSEDAQPVKIQWTQPDVNSDLSHPPVAVLEDPLLSVHDKVSVLEALIEILPRIGKDESLALSVVRALAIVTRNRNIADKLAEKKNIQRLFVMIKQLAGNTNEKLQSSFMLILRHIVEDEDTIRRIMRSEILQNFESRPSRPTDTTTYVRHMHHLALRSPELFVEVTNEKLEIKDYDSSSNPRPQILSLKPSPPEAQAEKGPADQVAPQSGATEGENSNDQPADTKDAKEPAESAEVGKAPTLKTKATEVKPPVVEHPSGVIHFILCEILSYKEVEDKDPSISKPKSSEIRSHESSEAILETPPPTSDTEGLWISTETPTPESGSQDGEVDFKKAGKPEFKAEEHPIYVYRCFLLQCLTELLQSYNQTKVEFINFSRKADPKAITPSKPRSGLLSYLLNDLIPLGTLNHEETIMFRKKSTTSNLALSVLVALCLKTNEYGYHKQRDSVDEEDDTELLFVRKFVLEYALKAYRDANTAGEALDVKYARLLCLADLFDRLLQGRLGQASPTQSNQVGGPSQKQIAKLMFDKNFLSALTTSIADIDLNFPQSKRAVKYILKPLKQLTSTAIHLSETSSISSTLGQTDDDEISTASSTSELDDEREETPDLFRNSTLGMFEPGREDESSSESDDDDEDMYDDEYDDGMEYEENIERDPDEVISDEDEEIEGAGHMEGLPGDMGMDVEVVIDGDDDGPSDEDDNDEDGSEGMDDTEDEALEVIDEITGDDNNSLAIGDEEEWQDEDEEGDGHEFDRDEEDMPQDPGQPDHNPDAETAVRNIMREFGGAEAALHRLQDEGALDMEIEADPYPDDGLQDDEEAEDDDDEDEGEGDDEELVYQTDYAEDDQGMPDPPWGWDPDDEQGMPPPRHHHHHHHARRMVSPWTIFPAGHLSDRAPMYRSHRPTPRAIDDGTNPLLHRQGRNNSTATFGRSGGRSLLSDTAATMSDFWVHGMDPSPFPRNPMSADSPVSLVNNIIAAIGQGGPGLAAATMGGPQGGALHFHIGGGPDGGRSGMIPRELQALLGLRPPPPDAGRGTRDDSNQISTFSPQNTPARWQEEARLLFGNAHAEKAQRIVNSLLRVLVPPAMAKKKVEEEQARLAMEKALAEERRVREEKEKAEKEARELKERQEQEQRDAAAAAAATEGQASQQGGNEGGLAEDNDDGAMEGVENAEADSGTESEEGAEAPTSVEEPAEATSSTPAERVRITIRGRDVDITGMGVDLEYLEALPEDLREEVLMHQLALQRSQAVAAGETPSDISREFLEALPPEIREELLQQEAQDRRRRERDEERRRRAAEGGAPARAEEMDPASFLASLDPGLRQAVLMDQDEEVLAQLPQAIAAEARALGVDRGYRGYQGVPGHQRARMHHGEREHRESQGSKKAPRKQIVQMLDKAGVATLLRLMFIPQQGSSRQSLNNILHDISQNRQTRAEVISLLLSILQDGSTDVNAVERSFAHLSLRAKQPATQKTPQPLKRSLTGTMASQTSSEMTPLMVVQQCLQALVFLTQYNPHIPSFFLTEHEVSSGLRSKSSRKGKGRETKAPKFALNALLSLLDRKLIMESSSCMEQLASLLQAVTHPLNMLLRPSKDKTGKEKKEETSNESVENTEPPDATTTAIQSGESESQPAGPTTVETATGMPDAAAEAPPVDGPIAINTSADENQTATAAVPSEPSKPEDEKAKKQRTLIPPVVPDENLRLVVGILAARECSAKTFRDTLSTINNLSAIPEAKEVFGKGLIEQAQDLGQCILNVLDELVPQIKEAQSGTDVQGLALAKFSPTSSDQSKLLRVLTALDYLFDAKRNNGKNKQVTEENGQSGDSSTSQEDILTALYENATFGALWSKLSDCLNAIRQGEGMLNVATILLPLIEALMVVCKNTTIKDAPLVKAAKEFSVTSPPPESGMESLFFRFTEDHRKILNDLVRNNPKLMSGTFSLLVKNPKVLEFDNKRNYFNRRLHSRGTEARHPQPPLQLNVRRDQVFMDSYKFIHFMSGDEIKYGKLNIRFHGEEGVDAGGVTREWFQVMSRQMFNPDYALFVPVASDRTTFHPNKLSKVNEEHLDFFKFIGRIIGKALYEGRALDCHFSRAVYKRILGKSVSIKDMETLDLDYYKSLLWMLENDITEIITETFSTETDDFGVTEIVDLIENGRNIPVTEENKHEYVQRVVEYRLTGSVQEQLEKFLGGFHDVVSPELIAIFNEQELELLISGLPDIDVDDWKNNTEYHNYSASSSQIQWFWRAVRSFDKEEQAKLLQFVTGTSKVPLNGFGQLEGMNGFSRFNIHRDYGNKDRLPSSHTCFNQLDLPEYDTYEQLRQQVYTAMTAGSEYFGFA
ncbi:MAG: hypothetical protein Q9222_005767 [Ikaeria aurantiellina]